MGHGEWSDIWQIHHIHIATQIHNFNLHFKHFCVRIRFISMKIMVSCYLWLNSPVPKSKCTNWSRIFPFWYSNENDWMGMFHLIIWFVVHFRFWTLPSRKWIKKSLCILFVVGWPVNSFVVSMVFMSMLLTRCDMMGVEFWLNHNGREAVASEYV